MTRCRTPESRTDSARSPRYASRWRLYCASLPGWPAVFFGFYISCLLVSSGCSMLSSDGESGRMRKLLDTSRIRGPLERSLSSEDDSPLAMGEKFSPEAKRRVDDAVARFEQGDYDRARKDFRKLAKEYKESSIGEEAQYRLGECYYAMGQYAKAQDAFDQLFEDYPSTRYVEPATRRLFTIAQRWLEISDPIARGEIRQVSSTESSPDELPPKPPLDPTLRTRILPNFHDKSRPMFDTQGRALQALKSIWLNDPVGPRAADALMLTATYYQRRKNYVEADRYFKILREEYPNSRHFEDAFVLGSHVKLMSYQGPYYEGSDLKIAGKLKEQSLHLFPASESRQQIREDLERVYQLEAERAWARVKYYQQKGRPRAVAIACMSMITEYPDTAFAAESRQILKSIDRRKLEGLPEITEFIDSLPDRMPAEQPESETSQPRVKSVSNSRTVTDEAVE